MKEYCNQDHYIIDDSRRIESILEKNNIKPDLIITSPPYYDLLNYDDNTNQLGKGQIYDDYLETISKIFHTLYIHSNENATFWLIIDTFKSCLLYTSDAADE